MPKRAVQRDRADLERFGVWPRAFSTAVNQAETADMREAQRLGEIAAAFSLFGLNIDQPSGFEVSAEDAYRANRPPATPANDARARFPDLPSRRVHIAPRQAIAFVATLDWVVIALAAELAARWGAGGSVTGLTIGAAAAFLASALALKAGLWLTETYRVTPARIQPGRSIGGLALGAIAGLILANALAPDASSAAALGAVIPVAALLLAGLHGALAVWIAAAHRAGVFAETIVLVGATETAQRIARRAAKSGEANIVAIVDDRCTRAPDATGAPVAGSIKDLLAWDGLPHVDRIVITVSAKADARVRAIIQRLRVIPNRVDLLLDHETRGVSGRGVERFDRAAVACVSGRPHCAQRALVKRSLDIVLGAALLFVSLLPMLLIALAIRIDSKGPILSRQPSYGFNNRNISIIKFRTVRQEVKAQPRRGAAATTRLTRAGAFLHRSYLGDLPLLFSVLKGEMSLVGPAPHALGLKAAKRYLQGFVAEYAHRHRAKPGITGWAQVSGCCGPIVSRADARQRVELDLDYVSRASLWFDLQILARTAPIVLRGRR